VFPDAPGALEGVAAGRVEAYAGTSLTVNSLLARADSQAIERAAPFEDPVIDGKSVRGYGAFGFRKDDRRLLEAFNEALARYVGSPQHLEAVGPFGFTAAELPKGATAASLCNPS
jgi:polar amino acid transport system substrate-binding protein